MVCKQQNKNIPINISWLSYHISSKQDTSQFHRFVNKIAHNGFMSLIVLIGEKKVTFRMKKLRYRAFIQWTLLQLGQVK